MPGRLAQRVQQGLLPGVQTGGAFDEFRTHGLGWYQVPLILGCDAGPGNGHLTVDRAPLHQAVEFPGSSTAQQLDEVGLRHPAFVVQGFEGRGCFLSPFGKLRLGGYGILGANGSNRKDAGADAGLEPWGKHQGEGGEEGGAVVATEPLPQLELLRGKQRRGFHRLDNVAGGEVGLGGRQLNDNALQSLRAEWDPDQLPGLNGEAGRESVGEGAGVAHRSVHRHVREP